jgi:hypothetical protein
MIRRFFCWLVGHAWRAGHCHGWSGIVERQCRRCQRNEFTQFDF